MELVAECFFSLHFTVHIFTVGVKKNKNTVPQSKIIQLTDDETESEQ